MIQLQHQDEISEQRAENPAYINWRAQNQILLGWLLSTISEGILSFVIGCDTSFSVWTSIEKQFEVQFKARVMQLRYEMNILRKDSMSIEEYCGKMKMLADKLACAGDSITGKDLLMRILNGLGFGYLDLASIITANKIDYDEAYALLLTHEARLEQTQNATDVFNANYSMMNANYSQIRGNSKRGSYGGGYRGVNSNFGGGRRPNFGRGMFFQHYPGGFTSGNSNFSSYGRGQPMYTHKSMPANPSMHAGNSDDTLPVCQIYHKKWHTADACWHRYGDDFVPSPKPFGRGRTAKSAYLTAFEPQFSTCPFEESFDMNCLQPMYYSPNSISPYTSKDFTTPGAAYVANFEGPADNGWYLDSGATHPLTNNMPNMHVRKEFKGSDQLIIGNGQGLAITYIGDAFLCYKHSHSNAKSIHTQITLKDILLVTSITKNLLSMSKLTTDNNLTVEFSGDVYYMKDTLRGASSSARFC